MKLTPDQQTACERLMPYARTVAYGFGGGEELVSEAYLALCQAVAAYDPARGVPLDQYAGVCIRNRLVTVCGRGARQAATTGCSLEWVPAAADPPRVYEAVESLPNTDHIRDVAVRHWLDGLLIAEIADELGLTKTGVKRCLREARCLVARALADSP